MIKLDEMNSLELIQAMIKKVVELGREPYELFLTDDDYDGLILSLDLPYGPQLVVEGNSVVYEENFKAELKEYRGMKVFRSNITRIAWK